MFKKTALVRRKSRQMRDSEGWESFQFSRYMHFGKEKGFRLISGMKSPPVDSEETLREYYHALYGAWGPQHWWPGDTQFEVIVGAYLTQNTAWTNVERALSNLRVAKVLSVEGIRDLKLTKLERLIRPSGYFGQKARRIKTFVAFLDQEYGGSLESFFSQPTAKIREQLLNLNGVGPETADSILLYAGNHPVFVVDAYTRRVMDRHEILAAETDYDDIRQLFERALQPIVSAQIVHPLASMPSLKSGIPQTAHPPSAMSKAKRAALVQIYNEMHGLIVGVGKHFCGKSQPKCDGCPLQPFLPRR
jgi:endonuclease III related protein